MIQFTFLSIGNDLSNTGKNQLHPVLHCCCCCCVVLPVGARSIAHDWTVAGAVAGVSTTRPDQVSQTSEQENGKTRGTAL